MLWAVVQPRSQRTGLVLRHDLWVQCQRLKARSGATAMVAAPWPSLPPVSSQSSH
jgi:hypothetical protein